MHVTVDVCVRIAHIAVDMREPTIYTLYKAQQQLCCECVMWEKESGSNDGVESNQNIW